MRGAFLPASWVFIGSLLFASPAWAHGGDDHGAPPPPSAAPAGDEHASSGETEAFSVVVKYPAARGGGSLPVRVYVAHAESSAPVVDADVRLELKGPAEATHTFKKTGAPGIYEASIPSPPDGSHANGIASVQAKDAFDLVVLGELSFGPMDPAPAPSEEDHHDPSIGQIAAGAVALALIAGGIGFAAGRRGRRRGEGPKPASAEVIS